MTTAALQTVLHASTVSLDGRGLLILGPSGAGKSALALRLITSGALLVADDRTELARIDGRLIARCPPALAGLIEARSVGILRADTVPTSDVALVADLGQTEPDRLPPARQITILGVSLPLVLASPHDHLSDALVLYLRHGRHA